MNTCWIDFGNLNASLCPSLAKYIGDVVCIVFFSLWNETFMWVYVLLQAGTNEHTLHTYVSGKVSVHVSYPYRSLMLSM